MKVTCVITCLFVVSCFLTCHQSTATQEGLAYKAVDSLLTNRDVFAGKRAFKQLSSKLSPLESKQIEAKLGNIFNEPAISNKAIAKLFDQFAYHLPDSTKASLLRLSIQNYVRLFNYKQAAALSHDLLNNYRNSMDSMSLEVLENERNVWNGLRNSPAQVISKKEHSEIELIDGFKLPVSLEKEASPSLPFLFDTGANISVTIESLARKAKMQFLDASVKVKNVLGGDIVANLALSNWLHFGNIQLENVVFLVFPDEALYFEETNFQMNGIIGFPVINALGEIQLFNDGRLIIPSETTVYSHPNLALDYLMPIMELVVDGDSLPFVLDSGAGRTWLYKKYYHKFQVEIDKDYQLTTLRLGGIGEDTEYQGFEIDIPLLFDSDTLNLRSAPLLLQITHSLSEHYYGNLGQDVIKSFKKMTLNFEDMFVILTDN